MTESAARRFATTDVVPAIGSRRQAAALLLALVAAYAAVFVCAALPLRWAMAAAMAAVAAAEITASRREPVLPWALQRVGLPTPARSLLRGLAVVLLAARADSAEVTIASAITVVVIAVAATLLAAGSTVAAYLARPVIASRGLTLAMDRPPATPPQRLLAVGRTAGAVLDVGLAAVAAAAPPLGDGGAIVLFAAVAAAPAGVAVAFGVACRRLQRFGVRRRIIQATEQALRDLDPEVIVYYGGAVEWSYQLQVWLRPLERIRQRTLLIVRDEAVLERLAGTPLPAIAVPSAPILMGLAIPSARAALYVGNTAANIHLLRRPELTSVFVGHGESDKNASVNPFTRVYREVWVAGDAGRERILRAEVGICADSLVKIGRPGLQDLTRRPDRVPRLTVLYAPTWEGFENADNDSSLAVVGPELIRRLLTHADLRMMYRPHPAAGQHDADVRRAHREVVRLLRQAGAIAADAAPERPSADRSAEYWAERPGHRILTPPCPDLYATFAMTDVLIADISSVPTDFLAADRPYAVVNVTGEPADAFRQRFPSVRSSFVFGPDLAGLDALLEAGRGGADPTADLRAADIEYILGPRTADPGETFQRHLDRLCGH
jgi:hypothetical protein